jgi:hypothetical protein
MSSIDDGVGVDVGRISNDCEAPVAVTDCAVATASSAESAMKDLMILEECGIYDAMSKKVDIDTD